MRTILATAAIAAMMGAIAISPAEAGKRHHGGDGFRGDHGHYHGGRHHHGRGYWRDGKWIALGIIGSAAVGALADDDDCYRTRRGRVVCH